jgi:hypothetical protein
MTERASDKFDHLQEKIDKTINPNITLKIYLPEGVEKEIFLELENDQEFIDKITEFAKKWLEKKQTSSNDTPNKL